MVALAGGLYLISTFAFAVIAGVVGLRVLALGRSTGGPERFLGAGLLGSACCGYGVMMAAIVARGQSADVFAATHPTTLLLGFGWIAHNLGVMCMLHFVVEVFRPGVAWARLLAVAMGIVMWTGWGGMVATGGLQSNALHGGYWVAFSVIGTYPFWSGFESFRYYRLMRRRVALGMAEPLVANRFLLWAAASVCAAASIWIVNVPTFLGVVPGDPAGAGIASVSMLVTAVFGLVTVGIYWFTFFPPLWYRLRFEQDSQADVSTG